MKRQTADSIKVASGIVNCSTLGIYYLVVTQANHCIVLYAKYPVPNHQQPIAKATFIGLGIVFYVFYNIWQVAGFEILINVQEYFSR